MSGCLTDQNVKWPHYHATTPETETDDPDFSDNQYVTYKKGDFWTWIRLYHLFGLLWLANFIIACQHVVIAGAIAGWYFVR